MGNKQVRKILNYTLTIIFYIIIAALFILALYKYSSTHNGVEPYTKFKPIIDFQKNKIILHDKKDLLDLNNINIKMNKGSFSSNNMIIYIDYSTHGYFGISLLKDILKDQNTNADIFFINKFNSIGSYSNKELDNVLNLIGSNKVVFNNRKERIDYITTKTTEIEKAFPSIEKIKILSNLYPNKHIYVNQSYGHLNRIIIDNNLSVNLDNNLFFNNTFKEYTKEREKIINKEIDTLKNLSNVKLYKAFGNSLPMSFNNNPFGNINYPKEKTSTNKILKSIYFKYCEQNMTKYLDLSRITMNHLKHNKKLSIASFRSDINHLQLSLLTDLDIEKLLVTTMYETSINYDRKYYLELLNHDVQLRKKLFLIEAVSIKSMQKNTNNTKSKNIVLSIDTSDKYNKTTYKKINYLVKKYQQEYPILFFSEYENFSTIYLNTKLSKLYAHRIRINGNGVADGTSFSCPGYLANSLIKSPN